jgi:hypothetical protein
MTSSQIAAFKSAVGGPGGGHSPDVFAVIFALIAAAALLLWVAYIILSLGEDFLAGRLGMSKLFVYKVRVLVLAMLVVVMLH